jgi:hypothetical protein
MREGAHVTVRGLRKPYAAFPAYRRYQVAPAKPLMSQRHISRDEAKLARSVRHPVGFI